MAQITIDSINSLTMMAMESTSGGSSKEIETLTSIVLDLMRNNIKLYGNCGLTQNPI